GQFGRGFGRHIVNLFIDRVQCHLQLVEATLDEPLDDGQAGLGALAKVCRRATLRGGRGGILYHLRRVVESTAQGWGGEEISKTLCHSVHFFSVICRTLRGMTAGQEEFKWLDEGKP